MTISSYGGGASSPNVLIQAISVFVLLVLMCSYLYAVKMGYAQELLFFHKSLHHSTIALGLMIVLLSLHDLKYLRVIVLFGILTLCIHSARNAYSLHQSCLRYQAAAHVGFIGMALVTSYGVVFNKLLPTRDNLTRAGIFLSAAVVSAASTAFVVLLTAKLYLLASFYLLLLALSVALVFHRRQESTSLNIFRVVLKVVLIAPYAYWSYRMMVDNVALSFARLYLSIAIMGILSALLDGLVFRRRRRGLTDAR